jgi:pimeloyl-ACP methyl ester carboxylesterase
MAEGPGGKPVSGNAAAPRERRCRLRAGAEVGTLESGPTIAGGPPRPPLVLVPGVGGAKELFAGLLPYLAGERRVVAVDLSPRVAPGRGVLASAADDLLELLDALELPRADLLGQSFGAVVSARAWRRRPERLRRLVLAAPATPPAGLAGARAIARWLVLGSAVRLWPRGRRRGLERFVRGAGGYAIEPELAGESFDALVERVRRTDAAALARRLLALLGHSWRRELADLTAPLLIVEGDLEAALLPRSVMGFFRTRPGTRVVTLPGGHMPFLVRPEEFARAVLEFLDAP